MYNNLKKQFDKGVNFFSYLWGGLWAGESNGNQIFELISYKCWNKSFLKGFQRQDSSFT